MNATVYYGDAAHRLTIKLPPSLSALRRHAAEAFGVQQNDFQLYHDPEAEGRKQGGRGRILVASEAQYRQIRPEDVVVVVAAGKRLDANDIARIFSTTNQRDYVQHPVKPPPPRQRPQSANPSFKAKFYDETTHQHDYTPKEVRQSTPRSRDRKGLTGDRSIGRTTSQDTYVAHALPGGLTPKTTFEKPYSAPFEKLTTNTRDYTKKSLPREQVRQREKRRDLGPWKTGVTEHQASYVPKALSSVAPVRPQSARGSRHAWVLPDTSYRLDYVPHAMEPHIHLEPWKKLNG
eukprot:gnl/MRDRNA2_/MRDRNA2_95253_c0_seq1.p1 gnl/MRDRNA2_/MRDRNA2_95253_c0~~gnl/MRDRNA2_/MRDRNA2_95253_c0_seq1.p1  ORF type:complete len:331 (-),score=51.53 gnl/MRDRNA2_/MRDRNA2_95253_c0_seq1:232-1101(-)